MLHRLIRIIRKFDRDDDDFDGGKLKGRLEKSPREFNNVH